MYRREKNVKICSILLAFMMILGVAGPAFAQEAELPAQTAVVSEVVPEGENTESGLNQEVDDVVVGDDISGGVAEEPVTIESRTTNAVMLNDSADVVGDDAGEDEYVPGVNFTNAAPLGDPVVGLARRATFRMTKAVAVSDSNTPATDAANLETSKRVVEWDGDSGVIELEAFATGTATVSKTTVPSDIVLVLDQSWSMRNNFSGGTIYNPVYDVDDVDDGESYYILDNGQYREVSWCDNCRAWTRNCYDRWNSHRQGTVYTPKTSATSSGTQFYEQQTVASVTNLEALQSAVTNFVNEVFDDAKGADGVLGGGDDIAHRIAVVGFAANEGQNTGIYIGNKLYQYGNAAQGVYTTAFQDMTTTAGYDNVIASKNALNYQTMGTFVNCGIELAVGILKANPVESGTQRNRVVIVFTDGVPGNTTTWNGSSGGSESTADDAISKANALKTTYGATVYTIGIFSGADATDPARTDLPERTGNGSWESNTSNEDKVNTYMHVLSSNFPNATGFNTANRGSLNTNLTSSDSGYYLSAGDAGSLNDIFNSLSTQVSGTTVSYGAQTVLKDIIADDFTLPKNADASKIIAYTVKATGRTEDGTGYVWEEKEAPDKKEDGLDVTVNGKTINVNGFDYGTNMVGEVPNSAGTDVVWNANAKKLVVRIPIEAETDFWGGVGIYTNDTASGIYADGNATTPIETFNRPQVNVPLEYEIKPLGKNVYVTNDMALSDILALEDQWTPDGNNNKYVNITYTFAYTDDNGTQQTITKTVNAGGILVLDEEITNLLNDKTVTVSYTMTAVVPENCDVTGYDTQIEDSKTATINVFYPELTATDTKIWHGATTDLDERVAVTDWTHGETSHKDVTMNGTAPTVAWTFAGVADAGNVVKPEATTDYNVATVKIGETDITDKTTIINAVAGENHHFTVEVKYYTLTLTKAGRGFTEGESFVFEIEYTKADGTTTKFYEVLNNADGLTQTITGLRYGTYKVTEVTDWSWRYNNAPTIVDTDAATAAGTVTYSCEPDGLHEATVTITNTLNKNMWLNDWAYAINNENGEWTAPNNKD